MCTTNAPATKERFPKHARRLEKLKGIRAAKKQAERKRKANKTRKANKAARKAVQTLQAKEQTKGPKQIKEPKQAKKPKQVEKNNEQFRSIVEFLLLYNSPEKCKAYFDNERFKEHGRYCPHCGFFENEETDKQFEYHCTVCEKKFTALTGTFLEKEKGESLLYFLLCMYYENSFIGGITAGEATKQLPYCKKKVSRMLQDIRRYGYNQSAFDTFVFNPKSDEAVYVMDTTVRDGKDCNRPDYKKGSYYGGVDRFILLVIIQKDGNARAYIVKSVNRKAVLPHILKHVPKGSTIYTDQHRSFSILKKKGYKHKVVNHKAKQYKNGEASTNLVEGFNSFFKTGLAKFRNSIPPLYAQLFVDAAIFRYNTRNKSESDKLALVVKNIFTKFKDQQHRAAKYHEEIKAYRMQVDKERQEKQRKKEKQNRAKAARKKASNAKKKAKALELEKKRQAKKEERERKQIEAKQKRIEAAQKRQAKKEEKMRKEFESELKRQAKKAEKERKQFEAQLMQQIKKAAKEQPGASVINQLLRAIEAKQPVNVKKIIEPTTSKATTRKTTANKQQGTQTTQVQSTQGQSTAKRKARTMRRKAALAK